MNKKEQKEFDEAMENITAGKSKVLCDALREMRDEFAEFLVGDFNRTKSHIRWFVNCVKSCYHVWAGHGIMWNMSIFLPKTGGLEIQKAHPNHKSAIWGCSFMGESDLSGVLMKTDGFQFSGNYMSGNTIDVGEKDIDE